ncbi:hypothetical protein HFC70_09180 [Agrobacterium sp. a22-2]|uniref:hypothetical protein n=1 Tax=Agrobacterium sp. a22-2 TaxID=2283840 RepID=UPI0014463ACE|nr:hypothetical protein [Agrobacterium sp. a22-2]NKN36528.1 hypothetical protein [Agrobacterium sp. a22-2]
MRIALTVFASLGLLALTSCQSKEPAPASGQSALDVMEKVAVGANRCWIKSGDAAFKAYEMAPELNSFSGKPRFLLVRRGSRDIRPVLVVQAEGRPAKLSAFGPMMGEPVAGRIATDVKRWAASDKGC